MVNKRNVKRYINWLIEKANINHKEKKGRIVTIIFPYGLAFQT